MALDITTEAVSRAASSPWSSIPGAYYVVACFNGANINYTVSVIALVVALLQGALVIRRHIAESEIKRQRRKEAREHDVEK